MLQLLRSVRGAAPGAVRGAIRGGVCSASVASRVASRVASNLAAALSIGLSIALSTSTAHAQPANDTICTATVVAENSSTAYTLSSATNSTIGEDCIPTQLDVWFTTTIPNSLQITVTNGTLTLPRISVFRAPATFCASGGTLTRVACSELSSDSSRAYLHVNAASANNASDRYFIRVSGGLFPAGGTITLSTTTNFATTTYQGELRENGLPATEPFDLQIAAFEGTSGGSVLFSSSFDNVTPDAQGRFNVQLPLNPVPFDGRPIHLELRVRPGTSTGAYNALTPRQRLVATPFALKAHDADRVPWQGIQNVPSGFADGVDDNRALGNTHGGISANAARDDHEHTFIAEITGGGPVLQAISGRMVSSLPLLSNSTMGVGLGTSSPAAPLHVREGASGATVSASASAIFERSSTNYLQILSPDVNEKGISFGSPLSGVAGGVYYSNTFGMSFRTGTNDTHMIIDTAGLIGMGRTPTANKLEVNGNASKTAAGSWLANSDIRIKQDIRPVTNALSTLDRVNLVSFLYTPEYRNTHNGLDNRRYLNVIAQQFATVFPDWVQSSGEKLPDGSNILQVDTYPLTIYSAAAVQELHTKVRTLEAQLAEQNARLKALEQILLKQAATKGQ